MLLIVAYFVKAVTFRLLHHYAVFQSGLYTTDSTKKELGRIAVEDWLKGPLLEVIAFFLIFIDYRIALELIFLVTLTNTIPPKRM